MPHKLLTVKFFVPSPRTALIERPRLLERFSAGLEQPLTLISAPAGFGKSTLLSAWLEWQASVEGSTARIDAFCWLSLDAADSEPARFWSYLVAAILIGLSNQRGEPSSALQASLNQLLDYLQSDSPPSVSTVLDELINAITGSSERLLLVLDDYHLIQTPEIHEQMTYLLEHQPPDLHMVIATRADPPLPIARLRARGQLSEFRAADLRFTDAETEAFFSTMTGVTVTGENLSAVQASTEGWIAGLQMAALALQAVMGEEAGQPPDDESHGKIKTFVDSFSGKHLFILDYLTDEVFNRQPEEIQSFLLKTSILERLSAGLCAAVLWADNEADNEREDLAVQNQRLVKAKATLDYLEQSNLFLVRLDPERRWFRYHHLFADLLMARLEQTLPGFIPNLHIKASRWYAGNGFVDDAIQHALKAEDWVWAAQLMEMHVTTYLELGQLNLILKWIDSLPTKVLRARPVLCAQVAEALAHAGRFQRVPPLIEMAETALAAWEGGEERAGALFQTQRDAIRVRGITTVLRAFGSVLAGMPEQSVRLVKNVLEMVSDFEPREMAWLHWACGYGYRSMGDLEQAVPCFEQAIDFARQANTMLEDMYTDLGIAYRLSGKLAQAVEVYQKVLAEVEAQGMRKKGSLSRVEAFLSAVLLDLNRMDEALQHIQKGVYYLQWWPSHNHITTAYIILGKVLLGMGRLGEAAEAIRRAEQEQHKGQVMPVLPRLVEYISILLWLERGDWVLLAGWLAAQEPIMPAAGDKDSLYNEYEGLHQLSLARVWIAKGRKEGDSVWFDQAFHLLSQSERPARRSQWIHALVEIYLLQALALYEREKRGTGTMEKALDYFSRSIELGLPTGYTRIYLQEGAPVAELLRAWLRSPLAQADHADMKVYQVRDLLDQFGPDQTASLSRVSSLMVEHLTEREQEVLQLLALGLSNKEMAQRMVVSEGTIKTHVHNLIGKLGAQSRTHVLARAKELGLL